MNSKYTIDCINSFSTFLYLNKAFLTFGWISIFIMIVFDTSLRKKKKLLSRIKWMIKNFHFKHNISITTIYIHT